MQRKLLVIAVFLSVPTANGVNVGRAAGKIGTSAASFAGTDGTYLFLPYDGALGCGTWTVAIWVYPTPASLDPDRLELGSKPSSELPIHCVAWPRGRSMSVCEQGVA